jgi:hypothetical protein
VLALLFLCGVALDALPESVPEYRIIHGAGEALAIAAVLAAVVDNQVKRRIVSEVAHDVLVFAVGWPLPAVMQDELKSLLQETYVRENFEMRLTIRPLEAYPGYVTVSMRTTYGIRNLTKARHAYAFRSIIEQSFFPEIGENTIETVELSGSNEEFRLRGPDLAPYVRRQPVRDRTSIEFERAVTLPRDASQLRFYTERTAIYRDDYSHIIDFIEPVIGVKIVVDHGPEYSCDVYFAKPGDVRAIPADRPTEWTYDGLFWRGQHARVRWRRTQLAKS